MFSKSLIRVIHVALNDKHKCKTTIEKKLLDQLYFSLMVLNKILEILLFFLYSILWYILKRDKI